MLRTFRQLRGRERNAAVPRREEYAPGELPRTTLRSHTPARRLGSLVLLAVGIVLAGGIFVGLRYVGQPPRQASIESSRAAPTSPDADATGDIQRRQSPFPAPSLSHQEPVPAAPATPAQPPANPSPVPDRPPDAPVIGRVPDAPPGPSLQPPPSSEPSQPSASAPTTPTPITPAPTAPTPEPSAEPQDLRQAAGPQPPQRPADLQASNQTAATGGPEDVEGAPSGEPVNLNTASLEELNGLGAGRVGRRIIENRPYGSVEDLLRKKVLTRKDFDTIKSKVTAR